MVFAGKTQFYAHTKDGADESEWQLLIEHLTRVADYAAEFGRDAGISELAKIAGCFHDLGKYSKEFQAWLRGSKTKVDHATASARIETCEQVFFWFPVASCVKSES